MLSYSCTSHSGSKNEDDNNPFQNIDLNQMPNYHYKVDVPDDWMIRDTTMEEGLKVKLLLPKQADNKDNPSGNIIISFMNNKDINTFTAHNINYLKANMTGIKILESGYLQSSNYNAQWFTYTKNQQGRVRDMINYIIPLNGFAYMITFGVEQGSLPKFRKTFDKIAKSFAG